MLQSSGRESYVFLYSQLALDSGKRTPPAEHFPRKPDSPDAYEWLSAVTEMIEVAYKKDHVKAPVKYAFLGH
jgi:hypothetical protein